MSHPANSNASTDGATLWETRFLPRRDLKFSRCADQQESWNVFDPLTRQSVRVGLLEYALLSRVDGRQTLGELAACLVAEELAFAANHLAEAAGRLSAMGLLRTGQVLKAARSPVRTFQQIVSSFVVWQVRGINPESLLRRLSPHSGILFSRAAVAVWCTAILLTAALVGLDFVRLYSQTSTWQTMLSGSSAASFGGWLLAVFLVTRGLHELGHAVVCHRHGIRCPDIGLLLIMCAPCVYCDVSESWRLPKRSQRAAVAAGGMYVELVIATIASWVWLVTIDSPINTLALQTMCVCSISTVVVNANPLMRFDGYYILADWLDEVNLRDKADRLLNSRINDWVLGLSGNTPSSPCNTRTVFLILFSAAGWIYRSLLALAIAGGVALLWSSWNLVWIGRVAACAILISWWGIPMLSFLRSLSAEAVRRGRRVRHALVLAAIILIVGLLPVPTRRMATGWTRPLSMQGIYASETAVLVECEIQDGASVRAGQPLFRFRDEILAASLVKASAAARSSQIQYASMRRTRDMHGYDINLEPFATRTSALAKQVEATRERCEDLKLSAVTAGRIVANQADPLPELADASSSNVVPTARVGMTWCDDEQLGRTVPAGTLLASIRGLDSVAVIPLTGEQLKYVSVGTHCRLRLSDSERSVISGKVDNVVRLEQGNWDRGPASESLRSRPGSSLAPLSKSTNVASYAAIVPLPHEIAGDRLCDEAVDAVFHTETTSLFSLARTWFLANLRFLSQ